MAKQMPTALLGMTGIGIERARQGISMATSTEGSIRLLRLLQLVSPMLPVGAFAYSQGLEWAVETGWVSGEQALEDWLSDQLCQALAFVDLPILVRMMEAAGAGDALQISRWIDEFQARRETAELRAEEAGRGRALAELLGSLGLIDRLLLGQTRELGPASADLKRRRADLRALLARSQLAGFACAAAAWDIEPTDALLGYAWSWAENLTLAGVKLIPLGQTAGQRILLQLAEQIPVAVERAQSLDDAEIGASMPALAIASSRHETQYTRLYRS